MRLGGRMWILIVVLVVVAVFTVDWMISYSRLDDVYMEASIDPPSVVADGKSSAFITVRVTENGEPLVHHLLQAWLGTGAGQLEPKWSYTDEDGMTVIKYSPNRYSPYDPQDQVELHVKDLSVGRLIEAGKELVVIVPQTKPGD